MLDKPAFIVIAGPNGSGKSFYSSQKSDALISDFGIKSFDFDLAYSDLFQKFISIMTPQIEENLAFRVKETFEEKIEQALQNKMNFSFQTNFHNPTNDKWREKFKAEGFKTYLYFLYLDSAELCKKRVEKRVNEGGHFVSDVTIETRYLLGLQNLDAYFDQYDEVNIIDTSDSENLKKVLKFKNSKVVFFEEGLGDIIFKNQLVRINYYLQKFINQF